MSIAHGLISSPQMPVVHDERELDWDDLTQLSKHRGVGQNRLQNIRTIHHKIARMMAAGCANVEVAAATGMNHNYLSVLRSDPAFQELLAHYEDTEKELFEAVRQRAAMLGLTAAEILQDRMLANPERISTRDLLKVMQGGFDYGGHKPAERSESLHVHTTQEEIERAKAGRKENVTVRRDSGGDSGESDDAIDAEFTETTRREEVREEGSEGDSEDRQPDLDSVVGIP